VFANSPSEFTIAQQHGYVYMYSGALNHLRTGIQLSVRQAAVRSTLAFKLERGRESYCVGTFSDTYHVPRY
jgi:hypothetical protein